MEPKDFSSYGSRHGNHEVMMRGTFASIRIKNEMLGGEEGGNTLYVPAAKLAIYDAAMRYQERHPAGDRRRQGIRHRLVARLGGQGTNLLGVKAVIAETSSSIHRSSLVSMGVLPLQFENSPGPQGLKLTGKEVLNIRGLGGELKPHMPLSVEVTREDGSQDSFKVLCRIDTLNEVEYFKAGGIVHRAAQQL
ncbi:hypothetical protein ACPA9J_07110 [Pseudomonas aeruginosa]